jgi:hypothetical protein
MVTAQKPSMKKGQRNLSQFSRKHNKRCLKMVTAQKPNMTKCQKIYIPTFLLQQLRRQTQQTIRHNYNSSEGRGNKTSDTIITTKRAKKTKDQIQLYQLRRQGQHKL